VTTLAYGSRPHPALGRGAALSALVHVGLLAVLFLGVRFQSHPPAVVTVTLRIPTTAVEPIVSVVVMDVGLTTVTGPTVTSVLLQMSKPSELARQPKTFTLASVIP